MRLKFYSKMAVSGSEPLRTVVTASSVVEGSFAQELFLDFEKVRKFHKLSSLPPFKADPHKWADLCVGHGADFRSIIDLWLVECCKSADPIALPLSCDLGEVPLSCVVRSDPFLPHACDSCSVVFASPQALGLHKRRVHGFMNPIRRMIWGSCCPICALEFHSRPRLIQHISYDSPSCRSDFLESEPLELSVEVTRTLDARDAVTSRANRRAGLPERQAVVPAMPGGT